MQSEGGRPDEEFTTAPESEIKPEPEIIEPELPEIKVYGPGPDYLDNPDMAEVINAAISPENKNILGRRAFALTDFFDSQGHVIVDDPELRQKISNMRDFIDRLLADDKKEDQRIFVDSFSAGLKSEKPRKFIHSLPTYQRKEDPRYLIHSITDDLMREDTKNFKQNPFDDQAKEDSNDNWFAVYKQATADLKKLLTQAAQLRWRTLKKEGEKKVYESEIKKDELREPELESELINDLIAAYKEAHGGREFTAEDFRDSDGHIIITSVALKKRIKSTKEDRDDAYIKFGANNDAITANDYRSFIFIPELRKELEEAIEVRGFHLKNEFVTDDPVMKLEIHVARLAAKEALEATYATDEKAAISEETREKLCTYIDLLHKAADQVKDGEANTVARAQADATYALLYYDAGNTKYAVSNLFEEYAGTKDMVDNSLNHYQDSVGLLNLYDDLCRLESIIG